MKIIEKKGFIFGEQTMQTSEGGCGFIIRNS